MKIRLIICLVLGAHWLAAQNQIQGVVWDENENPIGFCHVYNQTMELGKVSDIKGKFIVLANQGDSIQFSYVGYQKTTIAVTNSHIVNYIKVVLPKDSILLPSITIYADKFFKVPIKQKGTPIFIPGVSLINPPAPIKAGDLNFGATGVGGIPVPAIGIAGPITYFSRDEREKRKAAAVKQETRETISYQKFMAHDSVRIKLSSIFDLDSNQYNQVIYRLHENFPGIHKTERPNEIWNWLLSYFERNATIVKRNSYLKSNE